MIRCTLHNWRRRVRHSDAKPEALGVRRLEAALQGLHVLILQIDGLLRLGFSITFTQMVVFGRFMLHFGDTSRRCFNIEDRYDRNKNAGHRRHPHGCEFADVIT
jgi:hypothetical protein